MDEMVDKIIEILDYELKTSAGNDWVYDWSINNAVKRLNKYIQSTNAELVEEVARLRGLGKGACILAKDIRDGKSIPENGIEDTLTALRIIK